MKKFSLLFFILFILNVFHISAQNFEWAKQMGGGDNDGAAHITGDDMGNIYITGSFQYTVDFDPGAGTLNMTSAGESDIFISKLDAFGNLLWVKQIGGPGDDHGSSLILDDTGDLYVVGNFENTVDFDPSQNIFNITSTGAGFTLKLDASGNFISAKASGGRLIAIDNSGNTYLTGSFLGTVDFDPGPGVFTLINFKEYQEDTFISKFDASGNFIWAKQLGGTRYTWPYSIDTDGFGNVYVMGIFEETTDFNPGANIYDLTSAGGIDAFVTKLDAAGNFGWAKKIGGTDTDIAASAIINNSGNLYVAGSFSGTTDLDPGSGIFNLTSTGNEDVFISEWDSSGNFIWAKHFGGTNLSYPTHMNIDSFDNIYTVGIFFNTMDADPSSGIFNLTSNGYFDAFISKLDASGNFIWSRNIGGTGGTEEASSWNFFLDDDNLYIPGFFRGTVDFDPGQGTFNLTSVGESDAFILKLVNTFGVEKNAIAKNINIFPNPTKNYLQVENPQNFLIKSMTIYNVLGKRVKNFDRSLLIYDISTLQNGIYFVKIDTPQGNLVKKIIKE